MYLHGDHHCMFLGEENRSQSHPNQTPFSWLRSNALPERILKACLNLSGVIIVAGLLQVLSRLRMKRKKGAVFDHLTRLKPASSN